MMKKDSALFYDATLQQFICQGEWNIDHLSSLKEQLKNTSLPTLDKIIINGQAITKMDVAGAWLLNLWKKQIEQKEKQVYWQAFSKQHQTLQALVESKIKEEFHLSLLKKPSWLTRIGKYTVTQYRELILYLRFIGELAIEALRIFRHPSHLRLNALSSIIYKSGYQGLPIIALLSLMIGVVITYQMGLQLRNYGANIYIVDLLGLSVLREFGPLITAIMIAGRTGSAFTAQLGIMKMNQEIDALNTMGVTPAELLLIPRIAGLLITLPLLTMWSDIFGVIGGMALSHHMLNITYYDFLQRFPHVIPLRALLIGLGKAPVFALIIASIGCFQGMQVTGSAESVGKNTTKSVVLAIFFIIVADAFFSILFSKLKL